MRLGSGRRTAGGLTAVINAQNASGMSFNSQNFNSESEFNQKVIDEYTPIIFSIIDSIFTPEAPKATIKIGLIYLAKIMDFYPDFTAKYL